MNDTRILSAIRALHERFIEEPTEQKAGHIGIFIERSVDDIESPEIMQKLTVYCDAMNSACCFGFQSLARVERAAEEIWG